nr:isoform 2 of f-box only protein 21 [Quercus suber]
MDNSPLSLLPDELLEAIVFHLPPVDTLSFGTTCRRSNQITYEPLVWRRHCLEGWRFWRSEHDLSDRLSRPPAQTKWQMLYNQRTLMDKRALEIFEDMLLTQQGRISKAEILARMGYDAKDLLISIRDETPDGHEDVLARRYYASSVLGQIHRATALEKWQRLQDQRMVRLEEVLGSYDLFVVNGKQGDLGDIDRELDRIAAAIRTRDSDFDRFNIRQKAIKIAEWLRSERLVGNPSEDDYHALRNNYISIALFHEPHTSLPLQSVAIYCAVARRLGVNAKPSNYPHHVHAVVEAPRGTNLDGAHCVVDDLDTMHMDPWRSSEEVPREQLTLRLRQMGAPESQMAHHLGPTSNLEIAMRTTRNIMNSVQEARDRQRGTVHRQPYPDIENSWYGMLWSMLMLADKTNAALAKRRQCLPYLLRHYEIEHPEDLNLIETYIVPMFAFKPEAQHEHTVLLDIITHARKADENARPPNPRPSSQQLRAGILPIPGQGGVTYKIGTYFQHKRYGYDGIIVGWDTRCCEDSHWIQQMRVDELPRGREQPFYNVVLVFSKAVGMNDETDSKQRFSADDKSTRYVAEENIQPHELRQVPNEILMNMAGKWFKRWDGKEGRFVSNIRDEYPDD